MYIRHVPRSRNPSLRFPKRTFAPGVTDTSAALEHINAIFDLYMPAYENLPAFAIPDIGSPILDVRLLAAETREALDKAYEYDSCKNFDTANAWFDAIGRVKVLATAHCAASRKIVAEGNTPRMLVEATELVGKAADLLETASDGAWAAVEQTENAKLRGREF